MTRLLAALAVAGAALLAALPAQAQPTLRAAVTVNAATIRLGDLFTDAGAHAGDVVAPAPPPGSSTIFDANWLAAAAQEHGLDWQPGSAYDRATVERATRIVDAAAVVERLRQELGRSQSLDGVQIQLDNAAFRLLVAKDTADTIAIDDLSVDPHSGRFSALVSAPADDPAAERQRVTGRVLRMVRLPVLNRPVSPGEIISGRDLGTVEMRAERVTSDLLVDAQALIGKTPSHPLQAHQPLHAFDVQTPLVVHRDDLVTVVLETPSLQLSTQAKALDDGAMGATIRVANTKSGRIIDATVTGHNLVKVVAPALLAGR
jgi:flagellar basal body P-ring formation protein FlgA